MKAKFINNVMEYFDELIVSSDESVEDLINMIHSADRMLTPGLDPLLHTREDYKDARKKAMKILAKKHHLSRKEIQDRLTELNETFNSRSFLNEVFDVLTWSRKHLPKAIANDVEEAHEGGFGEKFQTALLKIMNKEELLTWYNKNFEVGEVNEELADVNPWNIVYDRVRISIENGTIKGEVKLKTLISFLIKHGNYNLSDDDIEDAAWSAYTETK